MEGLNKRITLYNSDLRKEDIYLLDKIIVILSKMENNNYIAELREYSLNNFIEYAKEEIIDLGSRPENIFNYIIGNNFEIFIEDNNFKIDEYHNGLERHLVLKRRDDEFGLHRDEHNIICQFTPPVITFKGTKIITSKPEFEFDGKIGKEFLKICKKCLKCRELW